MAGGPAALVMKRSRSKREKRQRPPMRRTAMGLRPVRARRRIVWAVVHRWGATSSASSHGGGGRSVVPGDVVSVMTCTMRCGGRKSIPLTARRKGGSAGSTGLDVLDRLQEAEKLGRIELLELADRLLPGLILDPVHHPKAAAAKLTHGHRVMLG